jgi:hypothetical protein
MALELVREELGGFLLDEAQLGVAPYLVADLDEASGLIMIKKERLEEANG